MQKRYEHFFLVLVIVSAAAMWYIQFLRPDFYNFLDSFMKREDRYAYATFLSSGGSNDTDSEDVYVTATRVLAYQIMHHPDTMTKKSYPFLVLIPPHVPFTVRQRLEAEGIQLVVVDDVLPRHWNVTPSQARWKDQFTKLRLFEMEQYNRILYMDNDMLLTRCLDSIFSEPEVVEAYATQNTSTPKHDEAPLPPTYLLAGVADNGGPGPGHPANVSQGSALNGGFFLLRPDKALFRYYRSVLEHRARFDSGMMEMGLLNYAHRMSDGGNMPWRSLSPGRWSSNWPNAEDLERGSATLHDKFWEEGNAGWIDRRLVEMWWRARGQMEGYWMAVSGSGRKVR